MKKRELTDIHINSDTCDCLECVKERNHNFTVSRSLKPYGSGVNHLEGKADEFLGGLLIAAGSPVQVYSRPNGSLLKTIPAGKEIGVIYSFVNNDGVIFWQIDGKGFTGFVKHQKGAFDESALTLSLRQNKAAKEAAIKAASEKRIAENDNPLYNFLPDLGSYFKWIAIAIIVTILMALFLRFK